MVKYVGCIDSALLGGRMSLPRWEFGCWRRSDQLKLVVEEGPCSFGGAVEE